MQSKPGQNLQVICLLLCISLGVVCLSLHPCYRQNIVFDRGSKGTNSYRTWKRIHKKGIAAQLDCSKFNAEGTFHDSKRSGRPSKTIPMKDRSVKQ